MQAMQYEYKLTIAIPTYNRLSQLKNCLNRAIQAMLSYDGIEVIVSDNCSTDGTKEYVESVVKPYAHARYYRNESNLGMDRNFLNCLELAQGEYIWTLGDDDYIVFAGLEKLLIAIQEQPDFIYLNTSDYIVMDNGELLPVNPRMKEEDLVYLSDKNELLLRMGCFVTFLSSLVFRQDRVERIQNKEQFFGSYFLQSHIALLSISGGSKFIINTAITCVESANTTVGYDLYYVWGTCFSDLLFQTAIDASFDADVVFQVAHRSYADTILSFVWNFRATTSFNMQSTWNPQYMIEAVSRYADLIRKFKKALKSPLWYVKCRHALRLLARNVFQKLK